MKRPKHKSNLALFCRESGPIEIVLFQVGDSVEDYFFVKHFLNKEAQTLMTKWQIEPHMSGKVATYAELGIMQLESLCKAESSSRP